MSHAGSLSSHGGIPKQKRDGVRSRSQVASSSSVESASGPESGRDSDLTDLDDSLSALEESSSEEESSEDDSHVVENKRALQADITPHHRSEKRPQRKTASKASDAWSSLGSRSRRAELVEVVVETPSKSKRRSSGGVKQQSIIEIAIETPSKSRQKEAPDTTPRGKGKDKARVEDGDAAQTPVKKQKLTTPRKQPQTGTASSAGASGSRGGTTKRARRTVPKERDEDGSDKFLIRPTSSDAYFAHHAPRSKRKSSKHQTSDNIIALPSLSTKVVSLLTASISDQLGSEAEGAFLSTSHFEPYYDYWWSLLTCTNRPLLMYGVGSKRIHLQAFVRHLASKGRCAGVVIRGESGGRIEDVVREMERHMNLATPSMEQRRAVSTPLEARAHAIVAGMDADMGKKSLPPSFMILIHNFDTTILLQEKSLNVLAILSASVRIHLCVDTCHINSGLIAGLNCDSEQSVLPWLWINLTSYVPMLEEILNERGSGISRQIGLPRALDIRAAGGSSGLDLAVMQNGFDQDGTRASGRTTSALANPEQNGSQLLSERAAIHILRSVTHKARGLFLLLAGKLLLQEQKKTGASTTTYGALAHLSRTNFIAMTPDALRSLLVEFTSHGLIRVEGQTADSHDQGQGLVQVADSATVSVSLSHVDLSRLVDEFRPKN